MNVNEELAVTSALELTDSELETAHGGWLGNGGVIYEYERVYDPRYGRLVLELVPVYTNYYGGGYGGYGDWDREHRGYGDWDREHRGHEHGHDHW